MAERFFFRKRVKVVRRLRVKNIRGCPMDKLFQIQTGTQSIQGAKPNHYLIEVTGPSEQQKEIPYSTTPLETILTFDMAGQYEATASLIDDNGNPLGGSSTATFDVTAPPVDVLVVTGLLVSDPAASPTARAKK